MKNIFTKTLSIILALMMLLSVITLISCNKDNPDGEQPGSSENSATDPVQPEIPENTIKLADLSKYYIVRPDISDQDLLAAVREFEAKLSEKLSVKTKGITTDFVLAGSDTYKVRELEILIGETNRDESVAFNDGLEYLEYGYGIIDSKIIISGRSIADTILALQKFTEDIIDGHKEGSEDFITSNDKFIKEYEHTFDTLTINGTDIKEFDIVYKNSKRCQEEELVKVLQDVIGRLSGVKPRAYLNNTSSSIRDKQIVITDSSSLTEELKNERVTLAGTGNTADKSFIMVDENTVWLYGDNTAAIIDAIEQLGKIFKSSSNGSVTLKSAVYDVANPQIRVMSFNVYVGTNDDIGSPSDRRYGVAQTILNYMPDVVGVQEASTTWMAMLSKDLGEVYDYVGVGRETGSNPLAGNKSMGEHCAIFYNKSKYNVVETKTYWLSDTPDKFSKYEESEYTRIMTYAIFERKSDGYRFMHVNTHMDFGNTTVKQVNKMLELIDGIGFDGVTFVTGDFNCKSDSAGYAAMINAGYFDSQAVANTSSESSSGSLIDFCFVNTDQHTIEEHKVIRDKFNGKFPSDHRAVYATFIPTTK